jgi:hypothetical protein
VRNSEISLYAYRAEHIQGDNHETEPKKAPPSPTVPKGRPRRH